MLRFLLLISGLGGFLFVVFPQEYYVDLLVSFLPYLVGFYAFVSLGLLLHLLLLSYSGSKKSKWLRYGVFFLRSLHLFWALFFYHRFASTYSSSVSDVVSSHEAISVLYANVFVDNGAINDLSEAVSVMDPDMLFLVEFSDAHYRGLEPYLRENYPHMNRLTWDQGYDGTLIASRYPFSSLPRYLSGYVSLETVALSLPFDDISVTIVHTASPLSERYFDLRNKQLDDVLDHLSEQGLTAAPSSALLLGDFNVTPWSYYYKRFVAGLGADWLVGTESAGPLYTRYLPFLPFLQAHIDHVFARDVPLAGLESVAIPGSDHRGIYFTILSE